MNAEATAADRVHPAGLVCDAARELWGPAKILAQIPAQPWKIDTTGALRGPAHTIRISRPLDRSEPSLSEYFTAIDAVPAGAVVVVEAVGELGGAIIGDAVANRLAQQGAAALVVEGDVRDYDGIKASGLASWVRGARVDGCMMPEMQVEQDCAVNCGGVVVRPGDVVCADSDGLFVVPVEQLDAVLEVAAGIGDAEARMFELIDEGLELGEVYKRTGRA
jgi:regulator of RNase E activity RraA